MEKQSIPERQGMNLEPTAGDLRAKFWILLTTSLVSSLIMLDSNVVAVSLPAIGRSLGASFTDIEWVVSAYLLSYASLLMGAGAYADLNGRKKAMAIGLVVFAVSSGICGAATSSWMLNTARAIQGLGGALLLTAALAIISSTFTGDERAKAFAVWGSCLGIALTSGPIIGGWITNTLGWRWIFFVNVPACAALIIATFVLIPESRDAQAKRLDFKGIFTFSPALLLLVWALIDGNNAGWVSPSILVRFSGALVFLVAFWKVETRQERPMIDFGLFGNRTFLGSVFAMVGYGAAAQVMVFYLPLFLQNAYGFDATRAGLAMLPFALPMVLAPRLTSRLAGRFSGRGMLATGLLVTALGNILFWAIARASLGYVSFVIGMLIAGSGAGVLNGETVKVLSAAVPPERSGMASGLASTTRFIGILVGVAALGAILSNVTKHSFLVAANAAGLNSDASASAATHVISGDLRSALSVVPENLRERIHAVALTASSDGFASASLIAAVVALIAALLTWRYVAAEKTKPKQLVAKKDPPCMIVDCRHPI
jgi:EmrB/QacA subfamily drug resistance transporter